MLASSLATPLQCLVVDDDPLAIRSLEKCIQLTDFLQLAGTCSNAIEAGRALRTTPVDVLFLDVDMPDMSGLDLLRILPPAQTPTVVLVTGSAAHAVDAFALDVADYLVKPVAYPRFLQAALLALELRLRDARPEDGATSTFVKVDHKLVRVVFDEVCYVEAVGDYVHVVRASGPKLLVHGTMRGVEEKFPARQFVRIHRSTIVNLHHVQAIEDHAAVVNGQHLPIGATYLRDVLARLHKF